MALSEADRLKRDFANKQFAEIKGIRHAGVEASRMLKLANKELRQLNETQSEIARSSAEIERLQNEALEASHRQTALLQSQLALSKRNDLERRRQNELKQAAFSVNEKISEIEGFSSNVRRYMRLVDQNSQVQWVGLTADEPHEIIDKQYVRDMLARLSGALSVAESALTKEETGDIQLLFSLGQSLQDCLSERQRLENQRASIFVPPADDLPAWGILTRALKDLFVRVKAKEPLAIIIALGVFLTLGSPFFIMTILLAVFVVWREKTKLKNPAFIESRSTAQANFDAASREITIIDEKVRSIEVQIENLRKKYSGNLDE